MSKFFKTRILVALGAALLLTGAACQPQEPPAAGDNTTVAATTTTTEEVAQAKEEANGEDGEDGSETKDEGQAIEHSLTPLPGKESVAPPITSKKTVSMMTNAGEIIIEIYPDAAPNAAARFLELAETGFYADTPISRVVPGFVAQFGVNWRVPHKAYKEKNFNDDPTFYALDRGTLAFAKAGPNTNSTQVFINFGTNNNLADPSMNFTTFGKVVKGMEVVDSFAQVGDPSMGLDQQRLWDDGGAYLESLDQKPTMIEKVTVID